MKGISVEALTEMNSYVDEAASLLAGAEVDVVVFSCTAGSLLGGPGYDKEIIERLEKRTGTKVTTTSTARGGSINSFKCKKSCCGHAVFPRGERG